MLVDSADQEMDTLKHGLNLQYLLVTVNRLLVIYGAMRKSNSPSVEEQHTLMAGKQALDANSVKFVSPLSSMSSRMEHDDEGASRRYRTLADCVATSKPQELDPDKLLLATSEEPNTVEEANGELQ
ncbi:hypothetical protein AXG93_3857s1140 [Marchantia polymorpha subsp. ruderalis]|uniref:Uncharacterized protein n=1 Tax=Marchantia polymorpha subsp. ruderalis TaxID=1480154 RepID=A0A176W5N2_MARPO|nr:hypothetical protein AXG93_3857s1140 [Marchantia polymorpha subsp. ruderalis]